MTQIYQNQTAFEVIVPTADSSMSLYPNEYVGGSYYSHIDLLTNVTAQNIDPLDVKYFYPESGEAGTSLSGFDTATGTLPIQVDVVGTSFNVSIQPISGLDIEDGVVVRTLNTLTDTVVITGQAGISVDVNVGNHSIDITNTQLGLTDVYATAPLFLELGEGNVSLSGSIAITPTDNGGAVALQTGTPEYQTGFSALEQQYLRSAGEPLLVGNLVGVPDEITSVLTPWGSFTVAQDLNAAEGVNSTRVSVLQSLALDPITGDVSQGDPIVQFSASDSFVDTALEIRNQVTLGVASASPGIYGYISGVLAAESSFIPLDLSREDAANELPLVALKASSSSPVSDENYLEVYDADNNSLIKLHGDGVVTAKTLEADTILATTVFAENIFSSTLYVVGPDTIVMTTAGGPQTIIADCSNGPVVVQLPDLTAFDKSLKVTALKADTSNNALSFVNGPNSTINGSPLSVSIVDQYAGKTITSAGINWYITGTVG